jgi:hypothetical protein
MGKVRGHRRVDNKSCLKKFHTPKRHPRVPFFSTGAAKPALAYPPRPPCVKHGRQQARDRNTDAGEHHLLGRWRLRPGRSNTVNGVFGHAFTAVFGIPRVLLMGPPVWRQDGVRQHWYRRCQLRYAACVGFERERRPMKFEPVTANTRATWRG